jgi:hypothetical protein
LGARHEKRTAHFPRISLTVRGILAAGVTGCTQKPRFVLKLSSVLALLLSNRLTPMHQGFVEHWHAPPFGFILLLAARLP